MSADNVPMILSIPNIIIIIISSSLRQKYITIVEHNQRPEM